MFLTAAQIALSIDALTSVHPFHGITFLACKRSGLPIGREIVFPLDAETDRFLKDFHRIDPGSDWFFQPFKSSAASKKWVRPDYAAKGLQAINTQTFAKAFLHKPNSRIWGWSRNYVSVLADRLLRKSKVPAFDLAVWLFRDFNWGDSANVDTVVNRFLTDFLITDAEKEALFDVSPPRHENRTLVFQGTKPSWGELRPLIPPAPDAKPDQGGTLAYLHTRGIGPAQVFTLEPAPRLNLITGDNGLGKSFLLEVAWWALTGTWAGRPPYPTASESAGRVEIAFAIQGELSKAQKHVVAFDRKSRSWPPTRKRPTIPGLSIYARVDGSFAVWDPARLQVPSPTLDRVGNPTFSSDEIWDGSPRRSEGLVRDWIRWQSERDGARYETFKRVLVRLSPPDLGPLTPGRPVRIPGDPREIPTLVHPYGETPILYASAGVKRVVALAYLVVWAWHEHLETANMTQVLPQRRMVILVDEMEAHLHPRWQRSLLSGLAELNSVLAPSLQTQFILATHSPLVMASAESIFDSNTDALFHLDLEPTGEVTLKPIEFISFGDVSSWLTSPVFELKHARSNEAEDAIEAAKALQLKKDAGKDEVAVVTERLRRLLAPEDRFWPRWIAYAERHGVDI